MPSMHLHKVCEVRRSDPPRKPRRGTRTRSVSLRSPAAPLSRHPNRTQGCINNTPSCALDKGAWGAVALVSWPVLPWKGHASAGFNAQPRVHAVHLRRLLGAASIRQDNPSTTKAHCGNHRAHGGRRSPCTAQAYPQQRRCARTQHAAEGVARSRDCEATSSVSSTTATSNNRHQPRAGRNKALVHPSSHHGEPVVHWCGGVREAELV